ncbi:MAG: DUF92 domain-containing protein [Cyclobacteriaceae bacterium]
MFIDKHPFLYLMVSLLMAAGSLLTGKINWSGALLGGSITFCLMLAFGWTGLLMIFVFFVGGTAASTWRRKEKEKLGLEEKNRGKRTHVNVISNAGAAWLCALSALIFPSLEWIFSLSMASSFASAFSDTVSSELGNVYGKKFIKINSLTTGCRGEDGVISFEGTALGLVASGLTALFYGLSEGWNEYLWLVFLAGIIGNLSDSIMGALFQQRGWMNNHSVNYFSTLLAALLTLCYLLLS